MPLEQEKRYKPVGTCRRAGPWSVLNPPESNLHQSHTRPALPRLVILFILDSRISSRVAKVVASIAHSPGPGHDVTENEPGSLKAIALNYI
jgi:hypothetical protein